MSIFEAYDTEFSSLMKEVSKSIADYKDSNDDKERGITLPQLIEGLFLQSSDLIKQMEIEARSSDPSSRKILNDKVVHYKKTVQNVKSDYEHAKTQFEKTALMGTSKSGEQRQRLLDSHDKLRRQNELIGNAHRMVSETEEVGMEITAELARNREKIESSRAKAAEYSGVTDSARRLIGSISRRESRQKFTVIFILVILVVLVVLLIYYKSR